VTTITPIFVQYVETMIFCLNDSFFYILICQFTGFLIFYDGESYFMRLSLTVSYQVENNNTKTLLLAQYYTHVFADRHGLINVDK